MILIVTLYRDLRCALIEFKLLYKMLPRRSVPWNHREPVLMLPNLCPSWNPLSCVWMYQRRCALDQGPTQGG